jgi:cytochrome oxidase Cu insertion factor (SCO1/SenC/PrrC family)
MPLILVGDGNSRHWTRYYGFTDPAVLIVKSRNSAASAMPRQAHGRCHGESAMRTLERMALSACLCLFSALAFAHEGHQEPAPASAATTAHPAGGTRDAKTWFTDTPLQDQNGNTLRFYSDALQNRVVLLNVIFTSCTDACPLITQKLKEVREVLGDKADGITYFPYQ